MNAHNSAVDTARSTEFAAAVPDTNRISRSSTMEKLFTGGEVLEAGGPTAALSGYAAERARAETHDEIPSIGTSPPILCHPAPASSVTPATTVHLAVAAECLEPDAGTPCCLPVVRMKGASDALEALTTKLRAEIVEILLIVEREHGADVRCNLAHRIGDGRFGELVDWLEASGWCGLDAARASRLDQAFDGGLDLLKRLTVGRDWVSLAAHISDQPRLAHDDGQGRGHGWVRILGAYWFLPFLYAAQAHVARRHSASPLAPRTVEVKGRVFGRLPKVVAGISWAFGGQAVPLEPVPAAAVQDSRMPTEPMYVPPCYVRPDRAAKPVRAHLASLRIDFAQSEEERQEDHAEQPTALSAAAGKLLTHILSCTPVPYVRKQKADSEDLGARPSTTCYRTTLRHLTQQVYPGVRLVSSYFESVKTALHQLGSLRLHMPDGLVHDVVDIDVPWNNPTAADYDVPIFISHAESFADLLFDLAIGERNTFRGEFIFDLHGAMKLPAQRPGTLRQLIRVSALWNAYWGFGTGGRLDTDSLPEVPTERWADLNNYLSPAAVHYVRTRSQVGGGRNRYSEAMAAVVRDVKELEAHGLVVIGCADRKVIRLLPPPEYSEAWGLFRKGVDRVQKAMRP